MNLFDFFNFFSPAHNEKKRADTAQYRRNERLKSGTDAQPCLSDVYKNGTRAKRRQADVPLCGRSMVEMLGVLAIIGVLSVGAMSGYSKAMMKYKLNKQTEQLNTLLSAMSRYRDEWRGIQEYIFLTPYFIKLGEIPEDMIQDDTSDYIYDIFGNKIALRNNSDGAWDKVKINYYIGNRESFELCQNIMQAAKAFSYDLYSAGVFAYVSDEAAGGSSYLYGDNYCDSRNKCLSALTLDDVYKMCQICEEDNQECLFQFLWKI